MGESLDRVKAAIFLYQGILIDWVITIILLAITHVYANTVSPYERDPALYISDPNVQKAYLGHEQVTSEQNLIISIWIPATLTAIIGLIRHSWYEAQSALLTYAAAHTVMRVIVDVTKLMVGRLRPDFFGRCQWDIISSVCLGDPTVVSEGRKSFPSGHSSSTFTGTTLLVLFLAGKTKAFVFPSHPSDLHGPGWWRSARLLRFGITISPYLLSFYVALSRIQDHVHHPTDVLVGALIGVFIATITYHIYWPSPFNPKGIDGMEKPKDFRVKKIELPTHRQRVEEEGLLREEV